MVSYRSDWGEAIELEEHGTIRGFKDSQGQPFTHASIQGIACITRQGVTDGGLVVLEGSHLLFNEYMEKDPEIGVIWKVRDLDDKLNVLPKVKICANPGELIIFDSRTIHCNIPPKSDQYRMCTYVSMAPRKFLNDEERELHEKCYNLGLMTGHNVFGNGLMANLLDPPTEHLGNMKSNRPEVIEVTQLNEEQLKLV